MDGKSIRPLDGWPATGALRRPSGEEEGDRSELATLTLRSLVYNIWGLFDVRGCDNKQ